MGNDSEFNIKIRTDLEGTGAKQAADDLKKVGDTAEAASKTETAATEKATLGYRQKREALSAVLRQLGGFTEAGLLMEPELAALAAILGLIELIRKEQEQWHDTQLKNIQASQELTRAIREGGDAALRSHIENLAELNRQLQRQAENQDTATEAMRRFIAVNQEMLASTTANIDATEALIEANIREQEVLGHFSAPEADAMVAQAKKREAEQKQREKEEKQEADIDLKLQRSEEATGEANTAQASLPGLEDKRTAQESAVNKADAIVESLKSKQKALDDAADEAAVKLPEQQKELEWSRKTIIASGQGNRPEDDPVFQSIQKKVNELQGTITAAETNRDATTRAKNTKSRLEDELKAIQEDIASRVELIKARRELARTLSQEASDAKGSLRREHSDFQRDEATHDETNRVLNRTALEKKMMDGTATDDEKTEYGAMTASGPQAARDEQSLIAKARALQSKLSRERPEDRSEADLYQLHKMLDAMLGYSQNNNASMRSMANTQQNMQAAISEILAQQRTVAAQVNNLEQRASFGSYPH